MLNNPLKLIDPLGLDTILPPPDGGDTWNGGALPEATVSSSKVSDSDSDNYYLFSFLGTPWMPFDMNWLEDYTKGASNAIMSNNFPFIEREEPETEEEELGQTLGDALTVVQG